MTTAGMSLPLDQGPWWADVHTLAVIAADQAESNARHAPRGSDGRRLWVESAARWRALAEGIEAGRIEVVER